MSAAREALEQLLADVEAAEAWWRNRNRGPDHPVLAATEDAALEHLRDLCQRGLAEPAKVEPPACPSCKARFKGAVWINGGRLKCGECGEWFDLNPAAPPIDGDRAVAEAAIFAEFSAELVRVIGCNAQVRPATKRDQAIRRGAMELHRVLEIDARAKGG